MTQGQVYPPVSLIAEGLAAGRDGIALAENLAFSVAPGEALLLRGPNGAGKSTLLLTLAGLLPALGGVFAYRGWDEEAGPALHYCGHRNAVRTRLRVGETLAFWAAINTANGLSAEAALARVGLAHAARLDAGYLSAGQQRRLVLARLLVSRRPVWLLDEPNAALDADGHDLVASLLAGHLSEGGLAVIATHDDIALDRVTTLTLGANP